MTLKPMRSGNSIINPGNIRSCLRISLLPDIDYMNVNVKPGTESGAALLAFMLILIVGTSYLLVNKLNANIISVYGDERTRIALYRAKQALIGYAVTFPETDALSGTDEIDGPGYLPCPDINKSGTAGTSCSDAGNTTIGRLPYKTLEIEDLRDASGQELWYAISENFRNNPKLVPLNSESPAKAQLSVDTADDIVAVIIAPGGPVGNQSRDPSETDIASEIQQYLEDDNNNLDTAFVTKSGTDFNDVVTFITRDELMTAVEKRVLGEVKVALSNYFTDSSAGNNVAYPWLTPFADPKAEFRNLSGTHNGSDNASSLTDTSTDFTDWDIQTGDTVINVTDGSIATVTAVTANTLSLDGLALGAENDFDDDDQYVVFKQNWSTNLLTGTAAAGSSGLDLIDTSKDFDETGVSAGDIIENLSDTAGSSWAKGVIESVSSTQITAKSLSGGTSNSFTSGNNYLIRSNIGRATGGSSTSLVDTGKDFTVMGIQPGDPVFNLTDGSMTTVNTVAANTLTLNTLHLGVNNDFGANDYYYLPRYNTDNNTREGLLSFLEPGKYFKTGYSVDWDFSAATATSSPAGLITAYDTALENYAKSSGGNSGTITVTSDDGYCMWVVVDIADCMGFYSNIHLIKGTVTSGTNTSILTDTNANFTGDGIKEGDIVDNYDDETATGISGTASAGTTSLTLEDTSKNFNSLGIIPYYHMVYDTTTAKRGVITGIGSNTTLTVTGYDNRPAISISPGDSYAIYSPQDVVVTSVTSSTTLNTSSLTAAAPDFDYNAGGTGGYQEFYRIKVATKSLTGTAGSTATGSTLDGGATDFSAASVEVGDIVKNVTDGSYGKITGVSGNTLTATLYSGADDTFAPGDNFEVYYDYVNTRQYEFRTRYSGTTNIYSPADQRKRDVCLGYSSDCSTYTGAVTLPEQTTSVITIRDFDINNVEVSNASVTIPASTSGSIRMAGLDYYLHVSDDEIPGWFVKNKWHQLVYVAYSQGFVPGGGATCVAGTTCLTLDGAGAPDNDKHALAVIAGEETELDLASDCVTATTGTQDRATGLMNAYFEQENCNAGSKYNDNIFQQAAGSSSYDDLTKIIE